MISEPARRPDLASLVAGNILGFSGTTAIPLWLATRGKADVLAGWIASGEIACIALAALFSAGLADRIGPRRLGLWAAALAAAANLLAMAPTDAAFGVGRLISGAAVGAVLAVVTMLAVRREDAQRALASMQIGVAAFAFLFYLALPALVARSGAPAVFAAQALTAIAALAVLARGLFGEAERSVTTERFRPAPRAVMVLLGLAALFLGQSMAWNSIFALGASKGFGLRQVGTVMAICGVCTIAGPLAARGLGERAGVRAPALAFAGLLAVDVIVLAQASPFWAFAAATVALVLLPGFGLPYVIGLAGRAGDARHAGAAPAFLMFGSALGPALASPLVAVGAWGRFALVAGAACLCGALLMGGGRRRT